MLRDDNKINRKGRKGFAKNAKRIYGGNKRVRNRAWHQKQ